MGAKHENNPARRSEEARRTARSMSELRRMDGEDDCGKHTMPELRQVCTVWLDQQTRMEAEPMKTLPLEEDNMKNKCPPMKYSIEISVDLSGISPTFNDLNQSINRSMANFGYPEKIVIRQTYIMGYITTPRPLTQDEINHIAALYIEEVQKSHPEWNTKVDVKETQ